MASAHPLPYVATCQVSVDVLPGSSGHAALLEGLDDAADAARARAEARAARMADGETTEEEEEDDDDDDDDDAEVVFSLIAAGAEDGAFRRDRELGRAGVSLPKMLSKGDLPNLTRSHLNHLTMTLRIHLPCTSPLRRPSTTCSLTLTRLPRHLLQRRGRAQASIPLLDEMPFSDLL